MQNKHVFKNHTALVNPDIVLIQKHKNKGEIHTDVRPKTFFLFFSYFLFTSCIKIWLLCTVELTLAQALMQKLIIIVVAPQVTKARSVSVHTLNVCVFSYSCFWQVITFKCQLKVAFEDHSAWHDTGRNWNEEHRLGIFCPLLWWCHDTTIQW